jgi:ribosomal protein S18 acetylase RimI-like enzyme
MPFEIVPFHAGLLTEAAGLLARRHALDRHALPALPASGEAPEGAQAALEAAWARPLASGAAALRDGRLVGYVLGDLAIDTQRGRTAWVRQAGQALEPGQDPELVRDLYAAAAVRWVAQGCFDHYVLAPAADALLLEQWFHLSFGLEQVHAVCDLETTALTRPELGPEFTLRRAGPQDAEHLATLSGIIWKHQAAAPVWGVALPERESEMRSGYAELVTDPAVTVWLALRSEQALGFQAYYTTEPGPADLLTPEHCIELSVAGTQPEAQGLGLGRALTAAGFAAAREAGYRYCLADWRSTNLLAARFWPRQGFQPVLYRLVRRVDERAAWATGR